MPFENINCNILEHPSYTDWHNHFSFAMNLHPEIVTHIILRKSVMSVNRL